MAYFHDDFERPDGPLGGEWHYAPGVYWIAGGKVTGGNETACWNGTVGDSSRASVKASFNWLGDNSLYDFVGLIPAGSDGYGYWARVHAPYGTWSLLIQKGYPTPNLGLIAITPVAVPGGTITIELLYEDGHLTATYNGGTTVEVDDFTYSAVFYPAIGGFENFHQCNEVWATGGALATLTVEPSPIGNFGTPTAITLTGTDTNWTPGNPGDPIFTVSNGTLSSQEILTATTATAIYDPGTFLGTARFTDPSTGAFCDVVVTSDWHILPGGLGQLSDVAVAYIERSAVAQPLPTILNQDAGVGGIQTGETVPDYLARLWHYLTGSDYTSPPYSPDPNNLPDIYARLWGGEEWQQISFAPPGTGSVKSDLIDALNRMQALVTDANLDLQQVIDAIGQGGGGDIQPILDLIGAPSEGEPSTLFLYLHDMLDDNPNSLFEANRKLDAIRTANNLNLAQIVGEEVTEGWIPPYTTHGIWDKLQDIRGSNTADIQQVLDYAITAAQQSTAAESDLNAIRTGNQYTIQSILNAIDAIPGTDIQPILDWLDTIRNGGRPSLETIMQQLEAIRTGDNLTLKSVLDAIGQDESNPNYSTLAVLALLAAAMMGATDVLAALILKLASGKLDLATDIVATLISAGSFFLDLWNTLKTPAPVKVSGIPLGYPGLGNVELGEPIPFVDGVNIAQAMHGAIIEVSTPGEHPYAIRNTQPTRYGRLGTFAFACDVGRLEAIQPIQYLNIIATPKAIVNPTGLVVQCKPGTIGTVIPYLLPE